MPAIFTHIQFGKEVVKELPRELRSLVAAHPQAFYAGTQGPDLLFYHKPLKKKAKNPARKKGWDLHAEYPEQFFLRGAKLLLADEGNLQEGKFAPTSAEAAYLLGFLCHFTLDSQCHPYIDERSVNGVTHGKIESELDKFQFRKIGKAERGFNAATLFSPSEEVAKASANVLGVSVKNTKVALRSMRKINGLFSHKREFVHSFCHFVLTLVGMNKTFGEMFLHKKADAACAPLLPVLGEKFDKAKPLAVRQITAFFDNVPHFAAQNALNIDFYRVNYSGKTNDKE